MKRIEPSFVRASACALLTVAAVGCSSGERPATAESSGKQLSTGAVVIYDDALASGWNDWSWTAHSLTNAAPVASGTRSIAVTYAAWGGLYFNRTGTSVAGLSTLDLHIHGGTNAAPTILAYAVQGNVTGPAVSIGKYCDGGAIRAGAFTTCHVPLAALGVTSGLVDGIELQEGSGHALSTMYLDGLQFVGAEPPPPPPPSSWIFRDAMVAPWTDQSWAPRNLASTSPVAAGSDAISVTMGPWQALYFGHPGFATTGHTNVTLSVHGGSGGGGAALRVRALVGGAFTSGTPLGAFCVGGAVQADAWTRCTVPLASIAPSGATLSGLAIQEDSGKTLPTISFDEIGFDDASVAVATSVSVSPSSAALKPGGNATFTATVVGSTSSAVTWTVQEGAAGGTVTAAGAYTAPATAGTYHVVATSQTDATKSAAATVTVGTTTTGSGTWVTGYYAGYQSAMYPANKVDFTAITHLVVAGILANPDGSLDTSFSIDPVNGPILAKDLTTRAHAAGRKAILMIGGAESSAGWEGATSSAHRATFEKNLLATMSELGFDGLDLDWEPYPAADQPSMLALAAELRAASPGILLTVPVGWVGSGSAVDPSYAKLAASVDQVNIMSYGMADAWPGWQSWHSSALAGETGTTPSSVSSSALAYAAAGIPKAKIGVGTAFSGSCWKGVTGPMQGISGASIVASDNVMTYAHVMASYYSAGAYRWDATAGASSLSFAAPTGPEGCTWVSYEDDASIAAKGKWVRANGFGGTIIWTVNQGYVSATGTNPPLDSVKKAFLL